MPKHGEGKMVNVEGYGPASLRDLHSKVFPDMNKSEKFFRYRWQMAGEPATVTRELFESRKPKRPEGVRVKRVGRGVSQEQRYADPNYLPSITRGDLAHLSGERNTGAARQTP
jgi:hypothetical protein